MQSKCNLDLSLYQQRQ